MKSNKQNQETKWPKVVLILVVVLAAFSSAMKELNQVHAMAIEAGAFIADWVGVVEPTVNARSITTVENCSGSVSGQPAWNVTPQNEGRPDEFHWSGRVAPGAAIEIKGINGDIRAESAAGDEVQVVAVKSSRRSDVNSVTVKIVEHAGGVTICSIYPNENSGNPNTCEPGPGGQGNSSAPINVRNNDVRVDFIVRVPPHIGFIGRTINGEIGATSLASNVVSRTVNGSIKISTSGYAEATTINGEISAKLGDGNWPQSLVFTTINGGITLDLPSNANTEFKAETLNGSITSDFPLNMNSNSSGRPNVNAWTSRRRVSGRIGVGGRELILRTLNGSINLRLAG
jgi:hypothetical protein